MAVLGSSRTLEQLATFSADNSICNEAVLADDGRTIGAKDTIDGTIEIVEIGWDERDDNDEGVLEWYEVGPHVGRVDGCLDGDFDGPWVSDVGDDDGALDGKLDGLIEGTTDSVVVGFNDWLGLTDGAVISGLGLGDEGIEVKKGDSEGSDEGTVEGEMDGWVDVAIDGDNEGSDVGTTVGEIDGLVDGHIEGKMEGAEEGVVGCTLG